MDFSMDFTDSQLERYARHIVLKEVGGRGQIALLRARVLLVGVGGLGSVCALYLSAAGVGVLGLVDDDVVALSNLQRQILYKSSDINARKVDCAAQSLYALNPDVVVHSHAQRLTSANASALIAPYDIIVDGSDSFTTRFAVAQACVQLGKTLVSAAVGSFDGQLAVFKGHLPDMPCYRCLVPTLPAQQAGSCADHGVIGALTGVMGAWQALEVIKEITQFAPSSAGKIALFEGLDLRARTIKLPKDPRCPHCQPAQAA
jgi:molybdopterin-synthase adenylyltransferase